MTVIREIIIALILICLANSLQLNIFIYLLEFQHDKRDSRDIALCYRILLCPLINATERCFEWNELIRPREIIIGQLIAGRPGSPRDITK